MDFKFFDPTNQSHMEIVNVMMQMENNYPGFSEIPPPHLPPSSVIDFSNGTMTPPDYYPSVVDPNSKLSFGSTQFTTVSPNSYNYMTNESSSSFAGNGYAGDNPPTSMVAMREMIFRIAAMQPVYIDPEAVNPPKRRNVKISKDPQSVAARHRRERISEKFRILQRLVPGGTKMDTASMLDEAIHYVKFLKTQVQSFEKVANSRATTSAVIPRQSMTGTSSENYWSNCDPYKYGHLK